MSWLTDPNFWEELAQWALLGYLLTRTIPKVIPRDVTKKPVDMGSVKVTEEHLKRGYH
jgi:hypothetical protein